MINLDMVRNNRQVQSQEQEEVVLCIEIEIGQLELNIEVVTSLKV